MDQTSASPVMGSRPAFRLGPYTCVERLSVGPLGETFRAKIYGLGGLESVFAVKRLHPGLAGDERLLARLATLVRLAARVQHEALVRADGPEGDGLERWLASEYVHGLDLPHLVYALASRGERLAVDLAAVVVLDAARALGYAHGRTDLLADGVAHAGFSPQSVIVTAEGRVKVVDLCLPRALARTDWMADPHAATVVPYLSPEVLQEEPPQLASDVWSLGAVLWELLAVGAPFEPRDRDGLLAAVEAGPIGVPRDPALGEVARACLQLSPGVRPTALGLAEVLAHHLGERELGARSGLAGLAKRLIPRRATGMFQLPVLAGTPAPMPASPSGAMAKADSGRVTARFWLPPQATAEAARFPTAPERRRPTGQFPAFIPDRREIATAPTQAAPSAARLADGARVTGAAWALTGGAPASTAQASRLPDLPAEPPPETADDDAAPPTSEPAQYLLPIFVSQGDGQPEVELIVPSPPETPAPEAPFVPPPEQLPLRFRSERRPPRPAIDRRLVDPSQAPCGGSVEVKSAPERDPVPSGSTVEIDPALGLQPAIATPPPSPTRPAGPSPSTDGPPRDAPATRRTTPAASPKGRREASAPRGDLTERRGRRTVIALAAVAMLGIVGALLLWSATDDEPPTQPPPSAPIVAAPLPVVERDLATPPTVDAAPADAARAGDGAGVDAATVADAAATAAHSPVAPSAEGAGPLDIRSTPPGAAVYVDGEPQGATPTVVPAVPGTHTVVVLGEGHKVWRREVAVPRGGLRLGAQLRPIGSLAALGQGAGFRVQCATPGELRLFIDNLDTGVLCPNRLRISVAPGKHRLALYEPRTGRMRNATRTALPTVKTTFVTLKY